MKEKDQVMDDLIKLRKKILELEQKNRLYSETERSGKVGGWQFDPVTLKQTWTDEVFRILEIDLEKGTPEVPKGLEFIDPEFRSIAEKAVQRAMEDGAPYNQEWIVTTSKGNKKWVNAVCNPKMADGKVASISGSFQDITSKKLVEEQLKALNQQLVANEQQLKASNQQLQANEQQLRAALQQLQAGEQQLKGINEKIKESEKVLKHSYDLMKYIIEHNRSAVAVHDKNLKYIYVSQRYLEDYKVKEKDIIGKHHYDIFPDLPQKWRDVHKKALLGEVSKADDDPYYKDDGTIEWTRWECRPWYEKDNTIGGFIVYTEVITERKRTEEKLKKNDALLTEVGNIAQIGGWEMDLVNRSAHWTKGSYDVVEIDYNDPVPGPDEHLEYYLPEYREMISQKMTDLIEQGIELDFQAEAKTAKGNVKWFNAHGRRIMKNGKCIKLVGTLQDITREKQAEIALKESEERLKLVIKGSNDAAWDWDFANKGIYYSPNWWVHIGYEPNELHVNDQLWYELTHPEDREIVDATLEQALETDLESYQVEFRLKHKLGHYVPVLSRGFITRDEDNNIIRVTGSNQDLTKIKKTETELIKAKKKAEANEANITAIIEGTTNSIWAFNRNYEILYINHVFQKEFLQSFGVLLEPGMNLVEALPYSLQPFWKPRYDRVIGNEQFTTEDAVPTDNGTIYIQVSFNPIIKSGKVIGGSCMGSNITSRKLIEIELQEAKERAEESEDMMLKVNKKHSAMIENIGDIIAIVGTDGMNKYQSPNVEKWFGWKPEELLGNSWDKIHPEDVEMIQQEFAKVLESEDTLKVEYRFKCKDGTYKPIELTATNFSNDPIIDGILLNYHDISERKLSEIALTEAKEKAEKSEAKLIEAQQTASLGHWEMDIVNDKLTWSDEIYNIFGVSKEDFEVSGENFYKAIHPDDLQKYLRTRDEKFSRTEDLDITHRIIRPNGEVRYVRGIARLSYDENNNPKNAFGTVQDITQIKQYEYELLNAKEKAEESDRLKSAFLANMSHEIRTPMNGILGFTNLLHNPNLTGEELQKFVDIIQKSGDRMLITVNDIIDISRIESGLVELSVSKMNINEQLKYLHAFFKPEASKKGIELVFKNNIPEQQNICITDLEKFNSIITNLIKNAIKFTNNGTIELGYSIKEENGSQKLEFYVVDTGIGIPKDRQKAIFDRFVQADIEDKQANQGSGLGLAISKAYAEMLGGEIWVDSEVGKGSTFYFTIDYNSESEPKSIKKNDGQIIKDENISDKLNILVVEDDETSQDLISILIEKFAKKIINVSSGLEAVEACRNNADIDLILMDIQLPNMNGYEATRKIRQFNEDVVIIAQTAYALTGDKEKAISMGCNDYISKPLNKLELYELIKKYFKKTFSNTN